MQQAVEDLPVFDRVVAALPPLRNQLQLGRFLGALVVDHKPRILYRFLLAKGSPVTDLGPQVILKVYGDCPRGEGPLQQLWRTRSLHVPHLMCGESNGCSWLVMETLDIHALTYRPNDQLHVVDQLASIGSVMHRSCHELTPLLRPLGVVMVPRWEAAAAALSQAGYTLPSSWLSKAIAAYSGGSPVPLHGDLAPVNMGRTIDGRLFVFDASALYGAPSFDAARWSARVGRGRYGPETLLKRWLTVEELPPIPDPRTLLAAECVLEAGSREIVRSRPTHRIHPTASRMTTHGVAELLEIALRYWS